MDRLSYRMLPRLSLHSLQALGDAFHLTLSQIKLNIMTTDNKNNNEKVQYYDTLNNTIIIEVNANKLNNVVHDLSTPILKVHYMTTQ